MKVSERVAELEARIESLLAENEELRRRLFAPRAEETVEPGPGAETPLSPRQVAEHTGLSPHAIYRAIKDGELKAMLLRGRLRVRPEDLEAWLDANIVEPRRSAWAEEPPRRPRRANASTTASGPGSAAQLRAIREGRA